MLGNNKIYVDKTLWWTQGRLIRAVEHLKDPRRDAATLKYDFEHALQTRYAIVLHNRSATDPKLVGDKFSRGSVTTRVYVVDLTTDKPVVVFDVEAQTPEKLGGGTYRSNETSADAAAIHALRVAVMSELAKQIQKKLATLGEVDVTLTQNGGDSPL